MTTSPICTTSLIRFGAGSRLAVAQRARPGQFRQRQHRGPALAGRVQPFHLGLGVGGGRHDREPPIRQHPGRPRLLVQRRRPFGLEIRRRQGQMRHRATPAAHLAVIGHQTVPQRLLGGDLQRRIEAGAHHQPTLGRGVLAEPGDQLAAHFLGEPVGARHRRRTAELRRDHRRRFRLSRLRRGDDMILGQAIQHVVAPGAGRVGILERVEIVRRLGQRGQERGLREGQLVQRLVEVALRRRGDAVGTLPEVDLVQVEFEDAVLAEVFLDPQSPGSPPWPCGQYDTWLSSSMFLATCWVMVEAPIGRRPCPACDRSNTAARAIASGSMPRWV